MQALSYAIRSKPDWLRKSKDKKIAKAWKQEALEQSKKGARWGAPLSEQMVDYVLEELVLHAERAKTGIEVRRFLHAPSRRAMRMDGELTLRYIL